MFHPSQSDGAKVFKDLILNQTLFYSIISNRNSHPLAFHSTFRIKFHRNVSFKLFFPLFFAHSHTILALISFLTRHKLNNFMTKMNI